MEDLRDKKDTLKILRDKQTTFQIKFNKQRLGRAISDEERKSGSERMKKYRVDKKKINRKNPIWNLH